MQKVSVGYFDQNSQLPAIKEVRPDLAIIYSQVLQDVLRRVDKGFKSFFARIEQGIKAGLPRYQGKTRYSSFTYPQYSNGWSLHTNKLTLSKIGTIKIKLTREVIGKCKTCTIKREADKWFAVFTVESEFDVPDHHDGMAVGIDVGLEYFASQSDGVQVDNPRFYRKSQKHLAKCQRRYSKLKQLPRNNPKKRKALKAVRNAHAKIKNQRSDFLHKQSAKLAKEYSLIVVEDLQVKNLSARPKPKKNPEQPGQYLPNGASAKGGLNKSINDAGWSTFINMLSYKVAYTGSKLIKVNPQGTSQTCPDCGNIVKKELSERWHKCECGASMPRDVAAAIVILSRGLSTLSNQSVDAPGES